jgi:hypothetical protein
MHTHDLFPDISLPSQHPCLKNKPATQREAQEPPLGTDSRRGKGTWNRVCLRSSL